MLNIGMVGSSRELIILNIGVDHAKYWNGWFFIGFFAKILICAKIQVLQKDV